MRSHRATYLLFISFFFVYPTITVFLTHFNSAIYMIDKLLMSHLSSIINIILRIVNLFFSSGDFPASCKSAIISPLIKKPGLDYEILKNYSFIIYIVI